MAAAVVDTVDQTTRSRMMAGIGSKDTAPEIAIRKALHSRGFRYRTHVESLPGRPDIVLPKYRAAILVHGCFWHGHDCRLFRLPTTRRDYWAAKIQRNRERDLAVCLRLSAAGWRHFSVWECALKGPERLEFARVIDEVAEWLSAGRASTELRGKCPVSGATL